VAGWLLLEKTQYDAVGLNIRKHGAELLVANQSTREFDRMLLIGHRQAPFNSLN
jgi:hypothetical protein